MNADGLSRIAMSSGLAASLSRATDYARAQGDAEVTLEHMLLALCDDPDAVLVMAASNVNVAELSAEMGRHLSAVPAQPHAQGGELAVAGDLRRILEAAAAAARGGRRREINGAIVLAAIVGDGKSAAAHVLSALGLTFEGAIRALQSKPAQQADASGRPLPSADAESILADARERVQSRTGGRPALRAPVHEQQPPEEQPEYASEEQRFEALPAPEPIMPEPSLPGPAPMHAPHPQQAPAHFEPEGPPEPAFEPTNPGDLNQQYDEYGSPGYAPADYGQPEFEPGPYEPPQGEHGYDIGPEIGPDMGPPPMPVSPPYPPPIPAPNPHEGWAPPPGPGAPGSRLGPPPAPLRPAPPMPPASARPGPPPLAPWPEPERQMGGGGMPAGHELSRQMPPQGAPRQGARRAVAARAEIGQLVENIPRSMRVAVRNLIEVRIARADVEALAQGLQGGGAAYQHEVMVTKAMSVRLVAPEGGFYIETASPETQWIEQAMLLSQDDFASWRWHVTPREKGRKRLQLIISARTVSAEGLAAETALPDQVITVRVRTNYAQAASRWVGWGVAAVAGGLLAKFGESAFALLGRMLGG